MKRKITLLGVVGLFAASTLHAQDTPPPIKWQQFNQLPGTNQLHKIPATGGFISSYSEGIGATQSARGLIMYDIDGNVTKVKNFNTAGDPGRNFTIDGIRPVPGGGFIVSGQTNNQLGIFSSLPPKGSVGSDAYAMKLDDTLGIEWINRYGGPKADLFKDIIPVTGGGYLAIGTTLAPGGDVSAKKDSIQQYVANTGIGQPGWVDMIDWWIVRLDNNGNILHESCFGGNELGYPLGGEAPNVAIQLANGNFFIGGFSTSQDVDISNPIYYGTRQYMWSINVDDTLGLVWDKTIGGSGIDLMTDAVETADGNIAILGISSSNDGSLEDISFGGDHNVYDVYVAKLNVNNGNIIWSNAFGTSLDDVVASYNGSKSLIETPDGNLIFAGYHGQPYTAQNGYSGGPFDTWVQKIDGTNGNGLWSKYYGGTANDYTYSLIRENDGSLVLYGVTNSGDGDLLGTKFNRNYETWILKLAECGAEISRKLEICPGDTFSFNGRQVWETDIYRDTTGTANCQYYETLDLIVRPSYTPTIIELGNNKIGTDQAYGQYQWYLDGNPILFRTEAEIFAEGSGQYGLVVENEFLCKSELAEQTIIFDGCEAPKTEWAKTYGGTLADEANSITAVSDGYIVVGSTNSLNGQVRGLTGTANDIWIIKIDEVGDTLWTKTRGGNGADVANSVRATTDGGFVVLGTTTYHAANDSVGNITATRPITGTSGRDIWVIKYDAAGNQEWEHIYGGSAHDDGYWIEPVQNGYIISGSIQNTSVNGTLTGTTSNGGYDGWLLKLKTDGTFAWQKRLGGAGGEYLYSVKPTYDGGYIATGYSGYSATTGTLDTTTRPVSGGGGNDIWVIKVDSVGNTQWQKLFGGSGGDIANAIATTADSGYVISGYAANNGTDGTLTGIPRFGLTDFWVLKLDSVGNLEWQKILGGTAADQASSNSIVVDPDGYVFAGYSASSNHDLAQNNVNGGNEFWVLKTDLTGNLMWQKSFGGKTADVVNAIIPANGGGYMVAGNLGAGNLIPDSKGGIDFYVTKLNECTSCTTPNPAITICEGDSTNIFGNFVGQAGLYTDTVTSSTGCHLDIQTVQLIVTPRKTTPISAEICSGDNFTFGSQVLTQSGIYRDTLTSVATGCDSIIVLTLNVLQNVETQVTETICIGESFTFANQQLTQAGTYRDTLQTAISGCDSVIVLTLNIANPANSTVQQTICEGHVFQFGGISHSTAGTYYDTLQTTFGCDSIVTLTLTVTPRKNTNRNESICSGESFAFGGLNLTAAGTYRDTLQTASGCDSIIVLTLAVNNLPTPTVLVNGNELSTQTYLSYQWYLNGIPVSGANAQTYTATMGGTYSVEVTDANNCEAKSANTNVSLVGIDEHTFNGLSIYPNPTKDIVNIVFSGTGTYQLTDITGKTIRSQKLATSGHTSIDMSGLSSGVYLIKLATDNGKTTTQKVIKD